MPRTIYSTAGAFPVALEGTKKVKTFPSGLVLVTQDYAVPRGQEAAYAATFAVGQPLEVDSPAIDGLYIFPEPEWVDSGDGFTRLTVSAYGRTNTVGAKGTSILESGYTVQTFEGAGPGTQMVLIPCLAEVAIFQFVLEKNDLPATPPLADKLRIFEKSTFAEISTQNTATAHWVYSANLSRFDEIPFGAFKEVTALRSPSHTRLMV
jgi:hypothetical protein